jgi:hypothetical protein
MVRLRSSPRFLHDKVIYLAFPPTLTTTALDRCSLGWFEARSCKPTLRDLPSCRASSASISSALIGDSPDWWRLQLAGGLLLIRASRLDKIELFAPVIDCFLRAARSCTTDGLRQGADLASHPALSRLETRATGTDLVALPGARRSVHRVPSPSASRTHP